MFWGVKHFLVMPVAANGLDADILIHITPVFCNPLQVRILLYTMSKLFAPIKPDGYGPVGIG